MLRILPLRFLSLALVLLLALPAVPRAAQPDPDDQGKEADGPQDPAFGPKRKAPPGNAVAFPGPTAQEISRTDKKKAGQGVTSEVGPAARTAGPKSAKAMYGDIVIHK